MSFTNQMKTTLGFVGHVVCVTAIQLLSLQTECQETESQKAADQFGSSAKTCQLLYHESYIYVM